MTDILIAGVDMAKLTFAVEVRRTATQKRKEFSNTLEGFGEFLKWCALADGERLKILFEATGRYGDNFAWFMKQRGHEVKIANPRRIRSFADAVGQLGKSDRADAHAIAEYGICHWGKIRAWERKSAARQTLADLRCHIAGIEKSIRAMQNRLECGLETPFVLDSLKRMIANQENELAIAQALAAEVIQDDEQLRQDKKILMTQIGVSEKVSTVLLVRIDFRSFASARKAARYAGLTPRRETSGTSLNKNGRISKEGPSDVRSHLFMSAGSAMQHDPKIREFAERMRSRGKPGMLIATAVMRKLVLRSWSMVVNNRPFDVAYDPQRG